MNEEVPAIDKAARDQPGTGKTRKGFLPRSLSIFLGAFLLIPLCLLSCIAYLANHRDIPRTYKVNDISELKALDQITKSKVLKILKETDMLDESVKRRRGYQHYKRLAKPIEDELFEFEKTLEKQDPRRDLLVNTFGSYQAVALDLLRQQDARSDVLLAGMRKVLLRHWLADSLSPSEKDLINTVIKAPK